MKVEPRDRDAIGQLRCRWQQGDRLFEAGGGLAILDPERAQQANAANFADATVPDRLVDLLRSRSSEPVEWRTVRSGWSSQLAGLVEPEGLAALHERLDSLIAERLDRTLDLARAVQEVFSRALVPAIVSGLSAAEEAALLKDQDCKLARLMRAPQRPDTLREKLRSWVVQFRAGRVVRRVLRDRARGRRPRREDMADPIVDLLPALGIDRAAFAVTGALTAVAGPPGAVAVCLLLELERRPGWAEKLRDELGALSEERFHASPVRAAPVTHRFVKEVLRIWTSPMVLSRAARTALRVGQEELSPGDLFHLSPFFPHRDPRDWPDPELFDPDRWLPGSGRGPRRPCAYAPFGWAPTSCVGAGLGTAELMLLCYLVSTRYRIETSAGSAVEVQLGSIPRAVGFTGTIRRR